MIEFDSKYQKDESTISLYAFWDYDRFPFLLGGEASKIRYDGKVWIPKIQSWRLPTILMPIESGLELKAKLDKLEDDKLAKSKELDMLAITNLRAVLGEFKNRINP